MNCSACWRSKKVLVSTSDVTPLIFRQKKVVIVSSIIAKIITPSKCRTQSQFNFILMTLSFNQCSLLFVASYYCSTFILCFYSIQCFYPIKCFYSMQCFVRIRFFCSVFILFSKCSVLILEMCSRYFDPVNINHQQSINIIHQTAPSFVLV
jgi:hypothetical protein